MDTADMMEIAAMDMDRNEEEDCGCGWGELRGWNLWRELGDVVGDIVD